MIEILVRAGRVWRALPVLLLAGAAWAGTAGPPLPGDAPLPRATLAAASGPARLLPAAGRDEISKRIERQVAGRGRAVDVDSAVSSVDVRRSPDDRVHIVAEIDFWSSDEDWMQRVDREFEVDVQESDDAISIRVELPEQPKRSLLRRIFGEQQARYAIELGLRVPGGTALDIENRYGQVTVDGVGGPLQVTNSSGDIRVEGSRDGTVLQGRYGNIRVASVHGELRAASTSGNVEAGEVEGAADLESRYGNIEVSDVRGDLEARASSGSVVVSTVGGSARIDSSYGDVEVRDVAGGLRVSTSSGAVTAAGVGRDAEVSTSYGQVEIKEVEGNTAIRSKSSGVTVAGIGGTLRVDGSYGDVDVERVGGSVTVTNGSGAVTIDEAGGDVSVRCQYGTVRVRRIGGGLQVLGSSSSVHAERVAGPADIETSYAGVRLVGVGGAVTVLNQSGSVTVRGLSGDALRGEHRVETSYADIEFRWPEAQAAAFRLESTYGDVDSDFDGTLRESGSRKVLEGLHEGGGAKITLESKSGSVRLRTD